MLNRKVYGSLEEAFADLPEETQKHSRRVAEYMRAIYVECCFSELTHNDPKAEARLRDDLTEMAYRVGLYHDIGKVYLPQELHSYSPDFGQEEKAMYRKHIEYNAKMIFDLYRKQFGCGAREETYAFETVKSKNEFWDGSGYPEGLKGKAIPVVARILGCADTLDVQASGRHSEAPFEEAIAYLEEYAGVKFDRMVVDVIKSMKEPLRKIFKAHIEESRVVRRITPVVPANGAKALELQYRTVVDISTEATVGAEAEPMFHLGASKVNYAAVAHLFADTKEKQNKQLRRDLALYLAAEGCDMLRQFQLAEVPMGYLLFRYPAQLLKVPGMAQDFLAMVRDQELNLQSLGILVPGNYYDGGTAVLTKNLQQLREAGVRTVLAGAALVDTLPEKRAGEDGRYAMTPEEVISLGFGEIRMDSRDQADADCEEGIARYAKLRDAGLAVSADGLDAPEVQGSLKLLGVSQVTGPKHSGVSDAITLLKKELSILANRE